MKTALDVINRIEWDEQLPSENFLVGYLDRFLGTIERPFSSFDWSLDICDVETGKNPSAVPQHRIQYFKYKDAKVWDKELRLDLVFGSTGNEKKIHELITELGRDEFDFLKYASNTEKEEIVQDVYQVDWAKPQVQEQVPHGGDFETIEPDETVSDSMTSEMNRAIAEGQQTKKKKVWPSYFFCIRIDNPQVHAYHEEFCRKYFNEHPNDIKKNKCTPSTLHITLGLLRIEKVRQYELAIQLMSDLVDLNLLHPIKLPFDLQIDGKLHCFGKTVAVILLQSEILQQIHRSLKNLCAEYELDFIEDHDDFNQQDLTEDCCHAEQSNTSTSQTVSLRKENTKNEQNINRGKKSTKVSDSKLPSMKTALDVINRIEWDEQLPSENFLVGYLDRFLGTIERPFSSFDWSLDICDVETGKNPSVVPQHRIQYFKYKDAKVWDKELRLDLVFGSTGNEKQIHELITELGRDEFDFLKYASNTEKEEIVQDVYQVDWAKPQVQEQVPHGGDFETIEPDETVSDSMTSEMNRAIAEGQQTKKKKVWPNYFFCIRIDNPQVHAYHEEFCRKYFNEHPNDIKKNKCTPSTLHITLGLLRIEKVRQYELAIQLMSDLVDLNLLHPIKLPFDLQIDGKLHCFGKTVAVILLQSEILQQIHRSLKNLCAEYELDFIEDHDDFNQQDLTEDCCHAEQSNTSTSQTVSLRKENTKNEQNINRGKKSTKVSDSKLPSMKTALDVINRIEWDEQLPSENFLVGYLDRFLGTIERPFSSFDWSLDICDVETGKNPSAVPQHRIQYFKYKDAKVWDKELRLDLVFGSTGNEKKIHELITELGRDEFDFLKYASNTEKEEIVQDVYQVDWAKPQVQEQVPHGGDFETIEPDETVSDSMTSEMNRAIAEGQQTKKKKVWPNYFFCIRIDNPQVHAYHEEFCRKYFNEHPNDIKKNKCTPSTLHITLGLLRIEKVRQYELAIQLMSDLVDLNLLHPIKLPFDLQIDGKLHCFGKTVAVILLQSEILQQIHRSLKNLCAEYELDFIEDHDFNQHLTLVKFRGGDCQFDTNFINQQECPQLTPESIQVSKLLLCAMGEREEDGFYRVISQCGVE
ncbi:uncharacterized protein LOC134846717 isoform X3 [Symsagittifera roscoffensis]|uniref:uncharacterized protein LOC134846717 isoform X3 n=1 Tax=Symsagittifera roscoffensis TaxID=84072 RepID=UPI00307C3C8B